MSTRWKKVVSIIGISTMLAANSISVMAEENASGNEVTSASETAGQPEDGTDGEKPENTAGDEKTEDTVTDGEPKDDAADGNPSNTVTNENAGGSGTDGTTGDAATDSNEANNTAGADASDSDAVDSTTDNTMGDDVTDSTTDNTTGADAADSDAVDSTTDNTTGTDAANSGAVDSTTDNTTGADVADSTKDNTTGADVNNNAIEDTASDNILQDAAANDQLNNTMIDEGINALAEDNTSEDTTEAAIPTELGWSDTKAGAARFKHNEYKEGVTSYHLEYYMEVYKGESTDACYKTVYTTTISGGGNGVEYCELPLACQLQYDFKNHETYEVGALKESGTYRYRLKVKESNETTDDFSEGKVSDYSSSYKYDKPNGNLSAPENVRWNSNGMLEWDAVEGADQYEVFLLTGKNLVTGGDILSGFGSYETKYDLSQYLVDKDFTYIAVVNAWADKDKYTIYSNYSDEVTYKVGDTNAGDTDSVATIVDKVNENSTTEEVSSAVTELATQYQGEDKNKLQIAMQTSEETQAQVKKLDDLYAQKANITTQTANVGEGVALEPSRISMVGAALNADKDASIQMNIHKPEPANDIISNNKDWRENEYGNAIQFSMEVAGINSPEDLAVPITITMPIPNNLNPDRLVILHEQADKSLARVEHKVDKEAGTVRFTITHFSEFIFAETANAGDPTNPGTEDKPGTDSPDQSSSSSSSSSSSKSSSSSGSSTAAPAVKAPSIGKSEGWSSLGKEVNEAIAGKTDGTDAVVWVKLNGVEIIPQSALRVIAGKDVTVCFVTEEGVIVNINASLLTPDAVGEIRIVSSKAKDGSTAVKIRNTVPDMNQAIAVFVKAQTGAQDNTLYFVDAANELIPFRTSNVAANGYMAFEVPFVNANYNVK